MDGNHKVTWCEVPIDVCLTLMLRVTCRELQVYPYPYPYPPASFCLNQAARRCKCCSRAGQWAVLSTLRGQRGPALAQGSLWRGRAEPPGMDGGAVSIFCSRQKLCHVALTSTRWLPAAGSIFCLSWLWFNRALLMQGFTVVLSSDTSCFVKCLKILVILRNNWFHNMSVTRTASRQSGDRTKLVALFSRGRGSFCSAFSQIKVSSPYKCYKVCCLAINCCKW